MDGKFHKLVSVSLLALSPNVAYAHGPAIAYFVVGAALLYLFLLILWLLFSSVTLKKKAIVFSFVTASVLCVLAFEAFVRETLFPSFQTMGFVFLFLAPLVGFILGKRYIK